MGKNRRQLVQQGKSIRLYPILFQINMSLHIEGNKQSIFSNVAAANLENVDDEGENVAEEEDDHHADQHHGQAALTPLRPIQQF